MATILVLAIIAVYLTWKARKYLLLLSVVAVTAGVSWFIFQNVPYLKTKFTQGAGVLQRKMMWLSAIELIKESPVIGVAPGDSEEALVVSYREKYFMEGVTSRFDAHNQYLMAGVSLGLAGLMALLFIFYFLFKEAYNQKNFILLSFLAVFALCCLTESLLQRRDGTLLFSFITSLLLFAPKGQKTNSYLEPVA
ncbi:O-antigen ligase family protein [Rufibacter tibetensis]|uniref:O-antigen ligase family protein n=1 Tax=Rufibacter tibetensis TaxID=512763 RepID=UPI001FDED811